MPNDRVNKLKYYFADFTILVVVYINLFGWFFQPILSHNVNCAECQSIQIEFENFISRMRAHSHIIAE